MVCISFAFCLGLSFIFAVRAENNCTAEQKAFDTLEFSVCWKNLYYYGHEACREVHTRFLLFTGHSMDLFLWGE